MYVGCTERPVSIRWDDHLKMLKHNRHTNKEMQKDFNNPKSDFVVYELEKDLYGSDAYQAETDWMIILKTYDIRHGYNYKDPQMFRKGEPIGKLRHYLLSEVI